MKLPIVCLCLTLAGTGLQAQTAPPPSSPLHESLKAMSAEPYRVGEDVSRPEKISGEPPVYTEQARKARLQGVVIVEAIIDENGDVTQANVLKDLPMGLSESALAAVQSWKFKPALRAGVPVKVYYTLTVNFQVQDPPEVFKVLMA